jgi:RHS repeat-associated protein
VVQTATDFNGHQTAYTNNGCSSSFPTTISLPMSLSRSMTWNCNGGVPSSVTDENSQPTSLSYENLWRPSSVDLPGDAQVSWTYNDTASPPNVVTTTKLTTSMNRVDTARYDGLGRVTQAQLADPEGDDKVDATYDDLGRTSTVSNPYRSIAEPTYGITTYYYDPLNRLTSIVRPDSSTATITYSANCATSADEAGKARTVCTDALGRATSVTEDPSGLNYQTTYTYDTLGNLAGVNQGGQTRSYTYDMLSRLTQAATPESGTVNFTYDANGNVLTRVAPKPNQTGSLTVTTTYTYDALNRLTGKSYSNGDAAVSYSYDQTSYNGLTITNGQGRRTGMSDGSGQTAWSYDAMGRVVKERRTIGSVTKETTYSYNFGGLLASITYPSGRIITYTNSDAARPLTAKDIVNSINYALSALYAPQGALASALHGQSGGFGGITASYTYNNRLQPATLGATSANGTVLDLAYSFVPVDPTGDTCSAAGSANNGNVTCIRNNQVPGRTQKFTYDTLNRIDTAQSAATSGEDCWGQSFTYDTLYWTNLKQISSTKAGCGAQTFSQTINNKNRIDAFCYDNAGNLTHQAACPPGATYTWNAENRLTSTADVSYTYDGDGQRVKKSNGTLYWYSVAGEVLAETDLSGNNLREFMYFAGRRIARRDDSGAIYYFFADHLGTARVMTNATGVTQQESTYYPFGGEQRVITNTVDNRYKFAGMERDLESGLDDTLHRKYPSNLARWLSPDPAGKLSAKIANPQSWNRYAYVLNNPLRYTDPLGLYDWAPCGCRKGDTSCEEEYRKKQEAFRNWLASLRSAQATFKEGSKEYKKLGKVLAGYGTEGGAGPKIAFGKLEDPFAGNYNPKTETITFDSSKLANASAALATILTGQEGQHYVDRNLNMARSQQEYRSFWVGGIVAEGLGLPNWSTSRTLDRGVVWNQAWDPATRQENFNRGFVETWSDYYTEKAGSIVMPFDPYPDE